MLNDCVIIFYPDIHHSIKVQIMSLPLLQIADI